MWLGGWSSQLHPLICKKGMRAGNWGQSPVTSNIIIRAYVLRLCNNLHRNLWNHCGSGSLGCWAHGGAKEVAWVGERSCAAPTPSCAPLPLAAVSYSLCDKLVVMSKALFWVLWVILGNYWAWGRVTEISEFVICQTLVGSPSASLGRTVWGRALCLTRDQFCGTESLTCGACVNSRVGVKMELNYWTLRVRELVWKNDNYLVSENTQDTWIPYPHQHLKSDFLKQLYHIIKFSCEMEHLYDV